MSSLIVDRLRVANLTLAMNKCIFLRKELLYLGFIVGDGKLKSNLERVKSLRSISSPKNVKEVRSLLGCVGYFRQFIQDYAKHAEPLYNLLRKKTLFRWTESCDQAKDYLIQ